MRRKKRSSIQIVISILEGCRSGVKKTKLLYVTNLSSRPFYKYMKVLEESGLIYFEPSTREYILAPKGRNVLEKSKRYLELLEQLDKIRSDITDLIDRVKEDKRKGK